MANPPPETPAGTDSLQYINIDGIGQVGVPANLQGSDLQTFVQTKVLPALKPVGTGIAALQGAREGLLGIGQDISQSTQALKGKAPTVPAPPQDQFTGLRAPLDYFSLGKPNLPKIAFHAAEALTRSAPAMAGFAAGSFLGGGAESPVGLGLGVLGAGAVSAFQSVGPYFAANLKANPKNPDAAWDLSWKQAAADGVISGTSFGLFGVGSKAGPFKRLAFQALGIQPAVGVSGAIAQGKISGIPPTATELAQTALESAAGTAIPLAGMALANPRGVFRGAAPQTDIRANPALLQAIDKIVEVRPPAPTTTTLALPSPEALSQSFNTPIGNLTGQEIVDWVKSNTQDPRAEKLIQKVEASGGGVDKLIQGAKAIIDKPVVDVKGPIALGGQQASAAGGVHGVSDPIQEVVTNNNDPWVVINNHLDLLRSYGRQGRLVANAATQALKDNTLTAPQVYAAFQAGNALARFLPETADHRVEFVNKILVDASAQQAIDNSGGGQTATGLRVKPTAQADGLIKLALDNNVTAENAAHEGMHVVEDYFRQYDPRTYSLLDRQFKLDDKYTADQVDPGVKRMLQSLQDPNNPGSSAWDAITKRYGLGDNPIEGREWMAYAFGQYDSAITSGMANIPGILPATRRFFNALRNIKEQLGNSLRGMGFRTSQDVFNSVSRGEQRGTSNPVPVGAGAQASSLLPFDISTVKGAIAYLKSEGIDDPVKTYGFIDPKDYITTAVRMRSDLLKQEPAPVWFSPLSKAVESLKQTKASGEHWLATLSKMPGVKDDELKWTGLGDRLAGSKNTFSKEDILNFLKENAVQVHDVLLEGEMAKYSNYKLPGGGGYRELLLTYPAERGKEYESPHWKSTANVLAHVRFDERTDDSGKPTLFLQEIQSDWHQAGRERGYSEEPKSRIVYDPDNDSYYPWLVEINGEEYNRTLNRVDAEDELQIGLRRDRTAGVPQAPYKATEAWVGMAMRRMIRWAAEHGFDKIAWTTGEQQADRYSLHHQVDSISVQKVPGEDNYAITADRHGLNVIAKGNVNEAELRTLIGGELSDKALAKIKEQLPKPLYVYSVGEQTESGIWPVLKHYSITGSEPVDVASTKALASAKAKMLQLTSPTRPTEAVLSGLDLKVGGAGMKNFYDAILPKIADKLGKKFGVKASKTSVNTGPGDYYYEGPEPSRTVGWTHFFNLVKKDGRSDLERQWGKVVDETGEDTPFGEAMSKYGSMALAEVVGGRMSRKQTSTTVHSLDITPEMKSSALQQGMPQFSVAREDMAPVAGEKLKGDGRKFTDFFAGVSKGTAGKGTTGKVYEPVLDASSIRPFINEYSKHLGNFDQHIATSIPGYREIQPMVGDAIVHALPGGGNVLDIGGSEGGLAKTITAMSGGKIRSTVLDPNQSMKEAFDSISHVHDTDYTLAAFGPEEEEGKHAWTEDNGVEIPYFRPIGKYDVVHESMTFQFISNARAAQIARAKELMKPSGIMVLQEKFNADPGKEDAHKANETQKDAFKRQYYEQKAMTQKAEQQLVGMHQNMISAGEMERILTSQFKYVSQYWDSGNFKGYVASNNANKFHAFLDALPNTQSVFSKVHTPRTVMDQGDFDVVNSQASIAKAIEDRGFVKDKDSGTIVWGKPIPKAAAELMSGGRMNFGKLVYPVGDQTFGKDHLATNPERLAVLRSLGFRDDEDAARWISKNWSWVNDRNKGSFTLNGLREVAGKKYVLRAAVTNLKDAGRPTDKFAIITIVPSEGVNNTLVWGKHPEVHGAVAEPQKSPAVLSDENIRNHTQASVAAFLGKHFAPDSRSTWDAARRKLQDYFLPVKRYEEAVGKSGEVVPEASSVYLAEELYHTRVGRRLRESEDHLFSPVVEKIAKSGISPKDFGNYLLAKHAEERNIAVAARNPKLPDAGSGMKTQDAIEHLNAISKGAKSAAYEDARKLFANIVNDTTRIRVEGGLIPADAPSKSPFQYYAPLMGWEEDPEGIPPESVRTGGAGFDVRGKESRTFTGRTSTPGDILSHAFMQHQEAIIRSEKNRVGQSLLRLAKDHPDDFDINTVAFEPRYNEKTGLVEYKFDPTSRMAENIIAVKDAGKVHYITMFDPLFARALKKLGSSNTGEFFRAMGKVTNYLSAINTSLSPEFIITNMTRTFIESGINISRKEIDGLAFKVMKGVPSAMKGGFDSMISGTDTPMARLHKQMMLDGGGVEFMGLSDLRSQERRIRDLFNKWDPNRGITGSARVGWNALWKFVRDSNHVVEGATRLSMYNEALKIGMSRPQAAHLAKNINLNFSRKGEWGPAINSMFMFYNAAAQTAATMFNSLKSARVRKIVASMVLMSAAMEYLNQSTAPTGPDGQSMYDKLEEQKKDFNLVIPSFFGTAEHYHPITLPLPIGYRVFHLIGRNIAAAMFFHKAPYEAAKDMLDYGIESFNPLGGSATGIGHFLPTLARPFIDLAANKDYLGRPIVPAQNPFGLQKPQSQLAWSNTSEIPKGIAQGLNAMSGGTQVRPGAIDISPETLTYLFNFITGSTGGMVNRIKNLGIRGLETIGDLPDSLKPPEDMTVNDVPFVRRLFATVNPHLNQQNFNTALTDVSQAQQEMKNAIRSGDTENVSRVRQEEGNKIALYGQFHMADQQIQHLRANLKRVMASTTLDAASKAAFKTQSEAQVSAILLRVNSAYRRLVIEGS